MSRIKYIIILLIIFSFDIVYATGGTIKQSSVIECNGKYYGNHGNPVHWHMVEKKNNQWVSISGEVSVPSCYLKPVNVKEKVTFSKCVDGDTASFIINNEIKTVRFLAIDTPEVGGGFKEEEPYGKEASDYTCNALKKGKNIYLEYDGNSDKEDKYGRILAFVYVDDSLLEAELVQNGLAKVAYIYGDYAHVDELRELEEKAKISEKGIWSSKEIILPEKEENKEEDSDNDVIVEIFKIIIQILNKIFDLLLK